MINLLYGLRPSFRGDENYVSSQTLQRTKASDKSENYMQPVRKESVPSLVAYMMTKTPALSGDNVKVDFYNTPEISQLVQKYGTSLINDINDLKMRAGKPGQVLNWIGVLPQTQIDRLDEIYSIADSMKKNGGKLGIIGIGGSKHTIENLLSLNDKKDNVEFLSSVNPDDIKHFVKKLGDLKTVNIMVASKSGTTLEPSKDYQEIEKILKDFYKKEFLHNGMSEQDAQKSAEIEAAKHFFCITDENENSSKLRKTANEKGYKCGVIHDECGGRFGAFDDHSLVALAYSGMDKSDMKKMLEASLKAQTGFMKTDLMKNQAAQRAMFNVDSILKGKTNQFDYYFGDAFEGTQLWNTQMKKESHKSQYSVSGDLVGPAFLHNSTEADLDERNTNSFYTFNRLQNDGSSGYKEYNALVNGSLKAYSQRHPVSVITLKDLSPESIAEFVELKHFETMYTGMLLRSIKNEKHPEVLPEVLQPHVGIYKKEVEAILKDDAKHSC